MTTRAAVVIGVNRTGGLDPLQAAAAAAKRVSELFEAEGYDVTLLTDEGGEVHAEDVRVELEKLVTSPPKYKLLVVFFSGHGSWHGRNDRWLFSGAPANGADAINLDSAIDVAKRSGIETVVFISDACRTIPPLDGQLVEGIYAFPNIAGLGPSKVDSFRATSEAADAYEASLPATVGGTGQRESILVKAFALAYESPSAAMVAKVQVDGVDVEVVPNRRLEEFLQTKVDELLFEADPTLQQTLEISVPSKDDVYMARVRGVIPPPGAAPPPPSPTRGEPSPPHPPARTDLRSAAISYVTQPMTDAPLEDPLEEAVAGVIPRYEVRSSFETECGFVLWGAALSEVAVTGDGGRDIESGGDGADDPAVIRIYTQPPGASVGVQLNDGRSFVVPALHGFIGHIQVVGEGVSNVAYVPSMSNYRYEMYEAHKDRIDRLRSLVSIAADHGRFQVIDDEAEALAQAIRLEKGLDPALGIYAAYAYSAAGREDQIQSVLHHMLDDLQTTIFDVRMLASATEDVTAWPTLPFCPVLTQAWGLLRPRGFSVPPVMEELRPQLTNSLWTTFGSAAEGRVVTGIQNGDLT